MFKKVLLTMLLASLQLASLGAASMHAGFDAGYSLNLMSTKTTWPGVEYKPGHGANLEFAFEYFPLDWLSINTGIRYVQKGFVYSAKSMDPTGYAEQITNAAEMHHYIELPLTVRFTLPVVDKVKVFAGGGGYVGWWMFSNSFDAGKSTDLFRVDTEILGFDTGDNRFEAGVIAEAGCDILVAENTRLLVTFRYLAGLTSKVKELQRDTYHRYDDTFMLTVGARFGIGG